MSAQTEIRNVAIVAHVDHGKTTLVDSMFRHAGTVRSHQDIQERALDTEDQERERGITILAKNTAIEFRGVRINIVDTPGHADFGGQVERTLRMADAVLLLVDAFEGPMPQTRFVLGKAFEHGLRALVMINKIDRRDARPDGVLDEVFDLFVELGAEGAQLDFPVVYGSGRDGYAAREAEDAVPGGDLEPLFEMMLEEIPPPPLDPDGPLQFQAASLDHDPHMGRIAVGRVSRGRLVTGQRYAVCHPDRDKEEACVVKDLRRYEGLKRVAVEAVECGDIAVVSGIEELSIGDTLCHPDHTDPLPAIAVDEPTITMSFQVSTSPLAGQEGKFVTSRQILSRLQRAADRDVALTIEETGDRFIVKGRGVMHLGVLVEEMRREGYEFCVGKPHVIIREVDGHLCEPWERATVEVPSEHAGRIIEYLGSRRGEMAHLERLGDLAKVEFLIPARGLVGARTSLLTLSQGEAVLSHVFCGWRPDGGRIPRRTNGVLVADRSGVAVPYAIFGLLDRGSFFVHPGVEVYEGMVVGEQARVGDLVVNICRAKKMSNMRASGRDDNVKLPPAQVRSLEECLEYIEDDELLEVTPTALRMRKTTLSEVERKRAARREAVSR